MKKGRMKTAAKGLIIGLIGGAVFLPQLICAGSLEPPAPPGSTMKTLDEIPPTWSQKLPATERFVLVLDGEAVLDKETGLVWEQSPDTTERSWVSAIWLCYTREVANRKGWRLPTIEELASLVDNDQGLPALPSGHPFSNLQLSIYLSSTTHPGSTDSAVAVDLDFGVITSRDKSSFYNAWCVRGGHGHDTY